MRFTVRNYVRRDGRRAAEDVDTRAGDADRAPFDVVQREVEVPTRTLLGLVTSLGGVSGLVSAAVSLLGVCYREIPRQEDARAQMQLTAIQKALEPKDPAARKASLQLLLRAGVLRGSDGFAAFVDSLPVVPQWEPARASPSAPPGDATGSRTATPTGDSLMNSTVKGGSGGPPPVPR